MEDFFPFQFSLFRDFFLDMYMAPGLGEYEAGRRLRMKIGPPHSAEPWMPAGEP